jgi:protein phosphatase 1G
MGAYLEKPVTAKRSDHGRAVVGGRETVYASSAMQGWRVGMEDAHVIVPEFDESTTLFAVFDGHGGKEVAEYCSRHMPGMLQSNAAYKSGDLSAALKQLFMETDRRLLEEEVVKELKRYVEGAKEGESDMEVLTRYISTYSRSTCRLEP